MGWAETRQEARAIVHSTFSLNSRYFSALGVGIGVPVSVRVHSKMATVGDLANEGFSRSYDDTERVVFLATDVARLGVKQKGVVEMDDGRVFRLTVRNPVLDDYTVEYQVTRV